MRVGSSPRTAGADYSSGGKFRFPAEYTNKFLIFDELVAQTRVVKKKFLKKSTQVDRTHKIKVKKNFNCRGSAILAIEYHLIKF